MKLQSVCLREARNADFSKISGRSPRKRLHIRMRLVLAGQTHINATEPLFSQAPPFAPFSISPALPLDLPLLLLELRINLPLVDLIILQFVADERATHGAEAAANRSARARGACCGADNCADCSTKSAAKKRTFFASRQWFSRASNQSKRHRKHPTIAGNLFPIEFIEILLEVAKRRSVHQLIVLRKHLDATATIYAALPSRRSDPIAPPVFSVPASGDALAVFVGECEAGFTIEANVHFDAVPASLIEQYQRR